MQQIRGMFENLLDDVYEISQSYVYSLLLFIIYGLWIFFPVGCILFLMPLQYIHTKELHVICFYILMAMFVSIIVVICKMIVLFLNKHWQLIMLYVISLSGVFVILNNYLIAYIGAIDIILLLIIYTNINMLVEQTKFRKINTNYK